MWDYWKVLLNGKQIDKVSFIKGTKTASSVKKSLVEHDGYDPGIKVVKETENGFDDGS